MSVHDISNIPGLHPLDASNTSLQIITKNASGLVKHPMGAKITHPKLEILLRDTDSMSVSLYLYLKT